MATTTPKPHIRPYAPTDLATIEQICIATAVPETPAHILLTLPAQYATPYAQLCPSTCFVLALPPSHSSSSSSSSSKGEEEEEKEEKEEVVGYILCAPDTVNFARVWTATLPADGPKPPPTHLASEFPAHLHIDILDAWTGLGWGTRLVAALEAELRARHVAGVHLGMAESNDDAGRFYRRLGFGEVEMVGKEAEGTKWFAKRL